MARLTAAEKARLPAWAHKYAHVEGTLSGTPLDFGERWLAVLAELEGAGWRVVNAQADLTESLLPQDRRIRMLMHWPNGPYTALDAQRALEQALDRQQLNYSKWSKWLEEIKEHANLPPKPQTNVAIYIGAAVLGGALAVWVSNKKLGR